MNWRRTLTDKSSDQPCLRSFIHLHFKVVIEPEALTLCHGGHRSWLRFDNRRLCCVFNVMVLVWLKITEMLSACWLLQILARLLARLSRLWLVIRTCISLRLKLDYFSRAKLLWRWLITSIMTFLRETVLWISLKCSRQIWNLDRSGVSTTSLQDAKRLLASYLSAHLKYKIYYYLLK